MAPVGFEPVEVGRTNVIAMGSPRRTLSFNKCLPCFSLKIHCLKTVHPSLQMSKKGETARNATLKYAQPKEDDFLATLDLKPASPFWNEHLKHKRFARFPVLVLHFQ